MYFPGSSTQLYGAESHRFRATLEIFFIFFFFYLRAHYPVDSSPLLVRVSWTRRVHSTPSHLIFSVYICVQITLLWFFMYGDLSTDSELDTVRRICIDIPVLMIVIPYPLAWLRNGT
jgi:hypothetical protein